MVYPSLKSNAFNIFKMDLYVPLCALSNIFSSPQYSSLSIGLVGQPSNIRSSPLHSHLHTSEPKYLCRLMTINPLAELVPLCLSLPPISPRLKFADRSFRNSSPHLWNSLPINLRSFAPDTHHFSTVISSTPSHPIRTFSLSRNQFLSCFKTQLFTLSYPP